MHRKWTYCPGACFVRALLAAMCSRRARPTWPTAAPAALASRFRLTWPANDDASSAAAGRMVRGLSVIAAHRRQEEALWADCLQSATSSSSDLTEPVT